MRKGSKIKDMELDKINEAIDSIKSLRNSRLNCYDQYSKDQYCHYNEYLIYLYKTRSKMLLNFIDVAIDTEKTKGNQ